MKHARRLLERLLTRPGPAPDGPVDVAPSHSVQEDRLLPVKCGGVPLLLTRINGSVHACADKCPHHGRPLRDGQVRKGVITCPWHGARLNICAGALPVYEA